MEMGISEKEKLMGWFVLGFLGGVLVGICVGVYFALKGFMP